MSTSAKKRRFVKPGLWFSTERAEVEDVNQRMRKPCAECGQLPEGKRLKIVKGSGRHQTVLVFCHECGKDWIMRFIAVARRAVHYLDGEIESVRE